MPARIDAGSEEPPQKKRPASADGDVAESRKRQRQLSVDEPNPHRPISKPAFIESWLSDTDWSRSRKSPDRMSQLPSPAGTFPPVLQRSASSASARKSAASVYDLNYRATMERYNVYIMDKEPDPEFTRRAHSIILRQRETPEMDDASVERPKLSITAPDKKLHVISGQAWTTSVPVPLDINALMAPLPLPKPKPDRTFGYAKAAFNASQLSTVDVLADVPLGPNSASPCEGLHFPFFVIEVKSQAKDGSLRVARNQAAGAGAIALNGLLDFVSRNSTLDEFDFKQPLFFSVVMDQELAGINAHWVGKSPDTNQYTFNLEERRMLPLKYDENIQVLQRAIKNIFDYAAGPHLKPILDALDEYRSKIIAQRTAELVEKTQGGPEPRAPLSPPSPTQLPPSKRG